MTATYDPDLIDRLVREAREDDARMMALGLGRWKANIRTKLAKIELERIAR